jgi:hypothetical protein
MKCLVQGMYEVVGIWRIRKKMKAMGVSRDETLTRSSSKSTVSPSTVSSPTSEKFKK